MDKKDVKVVIFCGGKGTRLREVSELLPKPLVPIGEMPILWHIMKGYATQGYRNFVLCLGYRGDLIRNFFIDYVNHQHDMMINLKSGNILYRDGETEDWNITLVNTGQETLTGGRLHTVKKYLERDPYFMVTYGDGVSDVNIDAVLQYHLSTGVAGTLTGIRASSKYGQVKTDEKGIATQFAQYPLLDDRINGGFMVFNSEIFENSLLYMNPMIEKVSIEDVIEHLTKQRRIAIFNHDGSWLCMDAPQHFEQLNALWEAGKAPWKIW